MLKQEVMVVDEWHGNGPQDLFTVPSCIQIAMDKMQFSLLSFPYYNPTASVHNVDSKLLAHTTTWLHVICGCEAGWTYYQNNVGGGLW
jgi:hypothetical protein